MNIGLKLIKYTKDDQADHVNKITNNMSENIIQKILRYPFKRNMTGWSHAKIR